MRPPFHFIQVGLPAASIADGRGRAGPVCTDRDSDNDTFRKRLSGSRPSPEGSHQQQPKKKKLGRGRAVLLTRAKSMTRLSCSKWRLYI